MHREGRRDNCVPPVFSDWYSNIWSPSPNVVSNAEGEEK